MPTLDTPQSVVNAVGAPHLANYYDIVLLQDAVGFSVKRRYPPSSKPATVVNKRGTQSLTCLIHCSVKRPKAGTGVSRVHLSTRTYGEWEPTHRWGGFDFDDPNCPTPDSVARLNRMPKPLALEFTTEFVYDAMDGRFYFGQSVVTGEQMLDYVYNYHCRTLLRIFRLKWQILQAYRWVVRETVWRIQDVCLWALEYGYDIRAKKDEYGLNNPFRKVAFAYFERASDTSWSQFFGFPSSTRSLFSNLLLLAAALLSAYLFFKESKFLRAIYGSAPLTTVALVFTFLCLDRFVPLALEALVCGLSRLRPWSLFIFRKVET